MNFYAYTPNQDGEEPYGTVGRVVFTCSNVKTAAQRAESILGTKRYVLFSFTRFHSPKTHKLLRISR